MKDFPNRRRRRPLNPGPDTSTWTDAQREAHRLEGLRNTPVAEMNLAVRIVNVLEENDVILAGQLVQQSYADLMAMANFGDKTLAEVTAAVKALGLDPPDWKKPPPPKRQTRERELFNFFDDF